MLAAQIRQHGIAPTCVEVPDLIPAADLLAIRVTAAAITPLDVLCSTGSSYFGAPDLPYTPGVQGVGHTPDGRRVWFTTAAGMQPGNGSMAQWCAVDASRALEFDNQIDDAAVAALGLSAVAAAGALERGGFVAGDSVIVLGASGVVGQVAAQLARYRGASRVIVVLRDPSTVHAHLASVADVIIDARSDVQTLGSELVEASGGGADLVIDPVWGHVAAGAVQALKDHGRLVNLGDAAGPTAALPSAFIRSHSIDIRGYTNLSLNWEQQCVALREILSAAEAGRIHVHRTEFPLTDVKRAWRAQMRGRARTGRSVLIV